MQRTVLALLGVAYFFSAAVAANSQVFVSDYIDNVVNIYNTSGKQLAQLTGFNGPEGLATDANGNLYVADTENGQILVYAPPYTTKPQKLSVPGFFPTGVAVITIAGATYVGASNYSFPNGAGSVIVYKNGNAQKPIVNLAFIGMSFLGFDAKGNIFVEGRDVNNNVVVGKVPKATSGGQLFKRLKTGNVIVSPGGIQVTTKGQIAIDDQLAASIFIYNPPKLGSLGNPIRTIPLNGSVQTTGFAFTSADNDLWTADALLGAIEYAYPEGGNPGTTISVSGSPSGIAVVPAQP